MLKKFLFAGCSKMPGCKAPAILSREAYLRYVERRSVRETQQMGVFQQPVRRKAWKKGRV
jgi:hypothetical protein